MYFKCIYVNILVWFVVLVFFVFDEGVKPKAHMFCFVHFGAALYLFFFYGASQLLTKLHCDIQFN